MMWWWQNSTVLHVFHLLQEYASGRLFIWAVYLILVPNATPTFSAPILVINEVYYDHPGRDGGWEFVELYNAGDATCDMTGMRLEFLDGRTGAARTVWAAPTGLVVAPDSYVLVAGASRCPANGCELAGSLENGPDAVRLADPGGVLDCVGYGEPLPPLLYEGAPARDAPPGYSLAREPDGADTGVNREDFTISAPSPGVRNVFQSDLDLKVAGEELLPCRGAAFSVSFSVENAGLSRFAGLVVLRSDFVEADGRFDGGRVERWIELDADAVDTVSVLITPRNTDMMHVETVLLSDTDQNSLNDTCRVVIYTSPGAVVINEIMYRPQRDGSEWIELINVGAERCNLNGWTLRDLAGSRKVVTEDDIWIEPGGFLVLAEDPDLVRQTVACSVIGMKGSWPPLNDRDGDFGADEIRLYDRSGILVERVGYNDMLGEERGRSIERVSEYLCSDVPGGVWHRCSLPGGCSPGAHNSTRSPDNAGEGEIRIEPNPFCAGRDGVTAISGSLITGERGFSVRIFDIDGFELRKLFGETGGARIFTCRWDGRDSRGVSVKTGLYICLVEFIGRGGAVCRRERVSIAVYGGS